MKRKQRQTHPPFDARAAAQLPLFRLTGSEDAARVRHTRNANAATLLARIERAAQANARVLLDLRGEISQYATSSQALDLLLVERTIFQQLNPVRLAGGLAPIEVSYLLPEELSAQAVPGLVDLACLGLHNF